MLHKIRIWDLPTRVFHWALGLCVLGLIASGTAGGNWMAWHFRLGYTVLALLLFRLIWGFAGGRWSRFSSFIYSPRSVLNYLRGRGPLEHSSGHSPTGAFSVFALLLVLLLQVATGLVSDDAIMFAGPLAAHVQESTVSLATGYHKEVGKRILIVLLILHVAAILFYRIFRKQKLTSAMVTGDKALDGAVAPSRDDGRSRLVALLVFGGCAGAVALLVKLAS